MEQNTLSAASIQDPLQKRLLEEHIRPWMEMYEKRAKKDENRHGARYALLRDFYDFCLAYFTFAESVLNQIEEQLGVEREYARSRVREIVETEWAIISSVVEQRELQRLESWLCEQDAAVQTYLPDGVPGMVAFLGKASSIRQQPYSYVSIASIPRIQYPGDKNMALPHEAGHHIWRQTVMDRLETGPRRKTLRKIVNEAAYLNEEEVAELQVSSLQCDSLRVLMDMWLEETFADVYGTVAAGADHAESLIGIFERELRTVDELFENDGKHAIRYLRPFVRIKTLEAMGDQDGAENLHYRWTSFTLEQEARPERRAIRFDTALDQVKQPPGTVIPEEQTSADSDRIHYHTPVTIYLPLPAVKYVLDNVVEALTEFAKETLDGEASFTKPTPPHNRFQHFKDHILQNVDLWGDSAYSLLLRPLSAELFNENVIAQSSSTHEHGAYSGNHTHATDHRFHTHDEKGRAIWREG